MPCLSPKNLMDAQGVAELLGLAQRNTAPAHQRGYSALPRPVVNPGQGHCTLWLRGEIEVSQSDRLASTGR